MQDLNKQSEVFKARRRQLLRMGAAGMPMVLTLRASASQVLISQLQCSFVVPRRTKILVDDQGRAWVGKERLRRQNGGRTVKVEDIQPFKDSADFAFTDAGTVPVDYRPDACPPDTCNSNGYGDDDDDYYSNSYGDDDDSCGGSDDDDDYYSNSYGDDDDDDDQCCGDDQQQEYTDCGYRVYGLSDKEIKPGDYVTDAGSWNLYGKKGLYITLSLQYAQSHGQQGGWPGISCIVSILNYLNT